MPPPAPRKSTSKGTLFPELETPALVGRTPVRGRRHKNRSLIVIDFIEESPCSNAIPPCLRRIALEPANVRAKAGVLPQLRIDNALQLSSHGWLPGHRDFPQVLSELLGLENPVFIQRICLVVYRRRENRLSACGQASRCLGFRPSPHRLPTSPL